MQDDTEKLAIERVTDGTAVLAHSGIDHERWLAARALSPDLDAEVHAMSATHPTAPDLARDVFWAHDKLAPLADPVVPLRASHQPHAAMLRAMMDTSEYDILHRTINGDQLGAIMAARTLTPSLLGALTPQDAQAMQDAVDHEALLDELSGKIAALDALGPSSWSEIQKTRHAKMLAEQEHARAQCARDAQKPLSQASIDSARQAGRKAAAQAQGDVESGLAVAAAFAGTGAGAEGTSGMSLTEKMRLAKDVAANRKLRLIAELCGRLKLTAHSIQRARVDQDPNEITGIELGRDLRRVLPAELVQLAEPDLEDLFYKRFADGALQQRKIEPYHKVGRGPIIIALDESGSMAGLPDVWAKAVTLTLLTIARAQERDCAVIHFSDLGSVHTRVFEHGRATSSDLLEVAAHFYDGGTAYDDWIESALGLVEASRFSKADVILISDGAAAVSPASRTRWVQARERTHMRAFGVLIATQDHHGVLSGLVDALVSLENLGETARAEELLFSI
jgi:uncharacterized protein with von Willebrand factor type A (vWA) domain